MRMIKTRYVIFVGRNVSILTSNMKVLQFTQRIITKLLTIYSIFSSSDVASLEIRALSRSIFRIRGGERSKNGYPKIQVAVNRISSVKRRRSEGRKM